VTVTIFHMKWVVPALPPHSRQQTVMSSGTVVPVLPGILRYKATTTHPLGGLDVAESEELVGVACAEGVHRDQVDGVKEPRVRRTTGPCAGHCGTGERAQYAVGLVCA
jgi:hypothetical protein